jgi:hypothetical protein
MSDQNANFRTEESIFIVISRMRTLMLLVALASGSGLAGCQHTTSSANSNADGIPKQWEENYRGGRVEPPAGH